MRGTLWRRIIVSGVLVLMILSLVLSAVAEAETPIQPGNRPTPVAGETNGELPAERLVRLNFDCVALREAAPSLNLLLTGARSQGVSLGTGECYRPLSGQVAAQQNATAGGNSACAASVPTSSTGKPVGTSMHGWGKASDFETAGGFTFSSSGYRFLKGNAAAVGWNHPGWAEPGGSSCPEPWHWEWVGDGGTMGADPIRADAIAVLPTPTGAGYSVATALGAVAHRGDAVDRGSVADVPINWLIVGGARTTDGAGYWLTGADGGVFSFGTARFLGSTGSMRLNQPIVGMAATPDGGGYWLVASDGGIFSFGNATFFGSMGGTRLNRPIVGMASTPTGRGYWLVASDGGIFSFGDARFAGSTGSIKLNKPIVGMARTPDAGGYWLVASDGGIFGFGNAVFHGSTGQAPPARPVVSMAASKTGLGYWLLAADGSIFSFGDARSFGPG